MRRKLCIILTLCFALSMLVTKTNKIALADQTTGLVAHYTFDGNLNDSSGNNNNGTADGNITYVDGVSGKAAAFDGNSYVEVPSSDSLDLKNSFTLSVWVYKNYDDNYTGFAPYFGKLQGDADRIPYALGDQSMQSNVILNHNFVSSSSNFVEMHQWELVTATYDGQDVKIYVNDKMTDDLPYPVDSLAPSSNKLVIGMLSGYGSTTFYKGYMDDLRIYNTVLSSQDIQSLYNDTVNGSGKGIVIKPQRMFAYYKFNGDLKDSSSFGNDASVVGNESYAYAEQDKGFKFDGSTYLEVQDSDSLEADTGITISAWIKLDDLNGDSYWPIAERPKASKTPNCPSYSFFVRYFGDGGGGPVEFSNIGSSNSPLDDASNDSKAMGKWCMVTATLDNSKLTYYVNGIAIGSLDDPYGIYHSGDKLVIGKMGEDKFFRGIMDEVRLYNYALKPADIKKLYSYRDRLTLGSSAPLQLSNLKVGASMKLIPAAISPDNKTSTLPYSSVKFLTSNTKAITVTKDGKLKATSKGKAVLTVTAGANSVSYQVTVK